MDRHALGAASKRRGNSLENETAKQLTKWSGHTFKRTPASGAWSASEQFGVSADVITTWKEWPYIEECKFYNSGNWTIENLLNSNQHFPTWVAQAVREGHDNNAPFMLVFRRNRIHSYILMPYTEVIARDFDAYVVSKVKYTSEVTATPETIKTITIKMDDLVNYSSSKFIKAYDKDWEKKITKLVTKSKVKSVDSIMKDIDDLGV